MSLEGDLDSDLDLGDADLAFFLFLGDMDWEAGDRDPSALEPLERRSRDPDDFDFGDDFLLESGVLDLERDLEFDGPDRFDFDVS